MAESQVYESVSGSDNSPPGVGRDSSVSVDLVARVLAVLGAERAGLVTDVDGTVSPIVARPEEAAVLPRARAALIGLRDRLAMVAVVTGRSVMNVCQMVDVDGIVYIGNHGLETLSHGRAETLPEARAWVPRVTAVLDHVARHLPAGLATGLIIENKGATASLHYRLAPDPDLTRRALIALLGRWAIPSGLRMEEGRQVINLLPPLTVNKGSAVTWLAREHQLQGVVYLGDDVTDAHAFRALHALRQTGGIRTLAIGVVGPETPPSVRQLVDTSVPTVATVAELLSRVLDGLKSSATMDSRAPGIGSS